MSDEIKREDHGYRYKVRDTEIYVRNRPRTLSIGEFKEGEPLDPTDVADAYLSVTDTFCLAPKGAHYCWFPWNEGRLPTGEMFYATNKVLNWWTRYMKLPKVQVFCDGGTHRSVTVFGAFLMTYFSREEYTKIVTERVPVNMNLNDEKQVTEVCHPIEYIERYLDKFPEDRMLFMAMKGDQLGRLDRFCSDIYRRVKDRYDDNTRSSEE